MVLIGRHEASDLFNELALADVLFISADVFVYSIDVFYTCDVT